MSPRFAAVVERYPPWLKADMALIAEGSAAPVDFDDWEKISVALYRSHEHILELREMLGRTLEDGVDGPPEDSKWLHSRKWLLDRERAPEGSEGW